MISARRVPSADPAELVVDTERYPLSAPGSDPWSHAVRRARSELGAVGCTVLAGFIRCASLETMRQECLSVAPLAYYDVETVNVYNTAVDPSLPDGHPRRITMVRGNAFVARDTIPDGFIIHQLYTSPLVQRFIAACFELATVSELADPLAGLCLNVVAAGRDHPWHFDKNELTVSLLIQEPEAGGFFEYCPNIRSAGAENFDQVGAVLAGSGEGVIRRLALRPGDLQLFRGRYSLHRVRTVHGHRERHSAIFAYTERPGVIGTQARTRQLFGRVLPAHRVVEDSSVGADGLLD